MAATAVTPSGVRDGDPAALAGLCERRGPAVLAYCHHVAGDAAAAAAAAEAFGVFRAAVVAAEDPASVNPEALLVSATRHAAARHAAVVAMGICAAVPRLLAARADRSITLADLDRLEEHLETCWTCRAPVARFQAAERAYRDPPEQSVPPEAAELIVAALTAAAPVRAEEPPPPPVPPPVTAAAMNGAGHLEDVPAVVDVPTTEFRSIGDAELEPAPAPAPVPVEELPYEPEPAPALPKRPRRASRPPRAPRPSRAPRERSGAVAGLLASVRASATRLTPEPGAARARGGGGTHLPRPQRSGSARGVARPTRHARSSSRMRPAVVLPIALVALALLIALFVSGVFGADDPTPTSGTDAPAAAAPPASTKEPEIVVVPGADDASAKAVEQAKSRARAQRRRQAAVDDSGATAAAPPPPPPAAATPAPTSNTGATTAKPKAKPTPSTSSSSDSSTSGGTGIDADNGATGAEQLPPASDTSTVPELAPPTDPAATVPPG